MFQKLLAHIIFFLMGWHGFLHVCHNCAFSPWFFVSPQMPLFGLHALNIVRIKTACILNYFRINGSSEKCLPSWRWSRQGQMLSLTSSRRGSCLPSVLRFSKHGDNSNLTKTYWYKYPQKNSERSLQDKEKWGHKDGSRVKTVRRI